MKTTQPSCTRPVHQTETGTLEFKSNGKQLPLASPISNSVSARRQHHFLELAAAGQRFPRQQRRRLLPGFAGKPAASHPAAVCASRSKE